jgi:hypothetical protein
VYRAGQLSDKSISPGVERFQKIHHVIFGIGISSHLEFDLFPNPDFSLVALGFDSSGKRLDLNDAAVKYRTEQGEYVAADKGGWQGIQSDEGWKAWLGPFALSENKMIISQEPVR